MVLVKCIPAQSIRNIDAAPIDQLFNKRFHTAKPIGLPACLCYLIVKLLADAPGTATSASITYGISRSCKGAADLAPLALPATLRAFADFSSLGHSRCFSRRGGLDTWECIEHLGVLTLVFLPFSGKDGFSDEPLKREMYLRTSDHHRLGEFRG